MVNATHINPTLLDWSQVRSGILAFQNSLKLEGEADAFQFFAMSKILKIDDDEIRSAITDGGDDRGIDAVYIDGRPERRVIHLFQFKHISNFEKVGNSFPSNEIDKIQSFLDCCLRKDKSLGTSCNPVLWHKVQDIWEALEEAVYSIHIHLCNNASGLTQPHYIRFEEALRPYQHASVIQHDLLWFSRHLSKSTTIDREYDLALVEDQYFGRTDGFAKGLIGTVRGTEIVRLITDPEFSQEVDDSLFEDNIRVYLGEENDINRKILTTALSQENSQFWYLNNGITIVCDRMDYQPRSANPKVRMVNPQIVNGGQTSHALFEAARPDLTKIYDVKLLLRVIETADRNFTNRVAEATNSQTPIRSRDIRSNDSIQIRIENALRTFGYYYERKNDQHIDQPAESRIDAVKLGQIILAYVLREPDRAKTASNRIFGEYYSWVFDESILSAENIVAMWRIYKMVDDDRRRAIAAMNSRIKQTYDESWIIEGVFHILYMLSLKCEQEGTSLYDPEEVEKHYTAVKSQIDEFMVQNRGQAAYRVFRSAVTKQMLARFARGQQLSLPLEPTERT
ncbi:AIPR family protein [Blastomonas fulva]|uniref:AIPR family protein n=1 Tax=Blastomonas fulva TaxID=1550728 RepID=UPI0025A3B320|nr:AIPR family protein [Blastomonas fulva]MDM7927122.1 AIPR family protein [Blastomonas fulva]MDM7967424.1 AIPR family protein [Blastomonas fulva]